MNSHFSDEPFDDNEPLAPTTTTRQLSGERSSRALAPDGCPRCGCIRIKTRHVARKAGGAIGTVAGAGGAFAAIFSGAEAGAALGVVAGPVSAACGGIAGAILAAIAGGTAGCVAGSALGDLVDENVLDSYECLGCGLTFSAKG